MDPTTEQRRNFRKSKKMCDGDSGSGWVRAGGRKREPYTESPDSQETEAKPGADQTVSSAYYCYLLQLLCENLRRLRPELWREKNWLLHYNNAPSHASIFTSEFFYQIQHGCQTRGPSAC
jgi:hypothetical protein